MDQYEYDTLKRRVEEKLATAKAEYEADIAALKRVWAMSQRSTGLLESPPAPRIRPLRVSSDEDSTQTKSSIPPKKMAKGEVSEAVEAVLPTDSRLFSWSDIAELLTQKYPGVSRNRSTIAQVLSKSEEAGQIEIVQAGSGRRPTIYRRVGARGSAGKQDS